MRKKLSPKEERDARKANARRFQDAEDVNTSQASTLATHGGYIDSLGVTQASHGTRLNSHDSTLASHGTLINDLGATQTSHSNRLATIEGANWVIRSRIADAAINAAKIAALSLDGGLFVDNSIGTRPLDMPQLYTLLDARYVLK